MTTTPARKAAKRKRSPYRNNVSKPKPAKGRQQKHQGEASRPEIALQLESFQHGQVPDQVRAVAEQSVAQTRAAYEQSKAVLQSVLESWQRSFGAVGREAIEFNRKMFDEFNRKMIDIADRRIANNFDLARRFAKAKNIGELITIQQDYWRTFSGLNALAEEFGVESRRKSAIPSLARRSSPARKAAR